LRFGEVDRLQVATHTGADFDEFHCFEPTDVCVPLDDRAFDQSYHPDFHVGWAEAAGEPQPATAITSNASAGADRARYTATVERIITTESPET
jgi:hypothetical protein